MDCRLQLGIVFRATDSRFAGKALRNGFDTFPADYCNVLSQRRGLDVIPTMESILDLPEAWRKGPLNVEAETY